MMPIITLTTDFGTTDHKVASIKGSILGLQQGISIVDITHHIEPHNLMQTAYILKNAYPNFPKGSIHLIGVDSLYHKDRKFLVIEADEHYFITSDNGLFSLIFRDIKADKIFEITLNNRFDDVVNFVPVDIFVPVAVHLCRGGVPEIIGRELSDIKEIMPPKTEFDENTQILSGEIIYIDHWGNVITNISKETFDYHSSAYQNFKIDFRRHISIKKIVEKNTGLIQKWEDESNYSGKVLAYFNEANLLEIAIYRGKKTNGTSSLFGLDIGHKVFIEFS